MKSITTSTSLNLVREFFEGGNSVCPFASKCVVHYMDDAMDYRIGLYTFVRGQAVVIVADKFMDKMRGVWPEGGMDLLKLWAKSCFVKLMVSALSIDHPSTDPKDIMRDVQAVEAPLLRDDSPQRPHIAFKGRALVTVCMAPGYPRTHPRYAPLPCLMVTWHDDVVAVGALPKVRAVMQREHGHVYDAHELVLPLPGN